MTPEQVDGYRTAGGNLGPIADWFLNQIATYGPLAVIGAGLVAIAAVLCSIRALRHVGGRLRDRRRTRRGIRRLEQYANHPANRVRKEDR